ncbi:MAG: putative porin [Xanthomonadales bacterium]|nr:putative porin [Xanthomonadales bacterium]
MKILVAYCALILFVISPSTWAADVSSSEIQALREQIRQLSERLDQLEQSSQQAPGSAQNDVATVTSDSQLSAPISDAAQDLNRRIDEAVDAKVSERMAAVSWAERMRWSGDFRYRYENIAVQGQEDRNRNRIRARAHLSADISDTIQVGFGLATGGDNPVSANQTLGGGGSSKPISLDLAYVEWTGLSNTSVLGGKFKQQQINVGGSGLLWDSDWRPEGTSVRYDNGRLFAVGLGTWIESDSNTGKKEFAYGLQAGLNLPLGEQTNIILGGSYYSIGSKGNSAFFSDRIFFGNSFDPVTKTYLYDYNEVEAFAEFEFELFDRPVMLFADYVQNLEVNDNDTGYALGVNFNEAKKKGSWELNYVYKKLEADAVLGLLTDSNFGIGGTNAKGSVISGAYAVHDNWNFRMTYFINQIGIDGDNPRDVDRLQLDLQFKYK